MPQGVVRIAHCLKRRSLALLFKRMIMALLCKLMIQFYEYEHLLKKKNGIASKRWVRVAPLDASKIAVWLFYSKGCL